MNNDKRKVFAAFKLEREFGIVMASVILILSLLIPWLNGREASLSLIFIALGTAGVAMIYPRALRPIYKLWMKIGHVLGIINSYIILSLIFLLLIFPVGIVMRILGHDPMERKRDHKMASYFGPINKRDSKHIERPF